VWCVESHVDIASGVDTHAGIENRRYCVNQKRRVSLNCVSLSMLVMYTKVCDECILIVIDFLNSVGHVDPLLDGDREVGDCTWRLLGSGLETTTKEGFYLMTEAESSLRNVVLNKDSTLDNVHEVSNYSNVY
jgi:hypothetical protein